MKTLFIDKDHFLGVSAGVSVIHSFQVQLSCMIMNRGEWGNFLYMEVALPHKNLSLNKLYSYVFIKISSHNIL